MRCKKVYYATRKIAKKHLKLINKVDGLKLTNVYKCGKCGCWHLTSINKKKHRYKMRNNMYTSLVDAELVELRKQVMNGRYNTGGKAPLH